MAATLKRPPTPTFCWSPKHILIEGSPGQDSINICDIFKFSSEFQQKCAKGSETERLILPVEVYPPNEDQCDLIRDRIIDAAKKQADTYLVKGKVDKFASGGEKWYYLLCEKGMTVYSRDPGSRRSNHDIYGVDKENTAYQKDGVKNHVIVNKQSTSRGPAGLREPRKTHTKKPPLGCLCKFKLILRLNPGKYWYFANTLSTEGDHNHQRIPYREKHLSMRSLTPDQKASAARFSQVTPSSAAKILTADLTGGLPPTTHQLAYNRTASLSQEGIEKKTSQAEQLLDYMRTEVAAKRKRFVALFHEITHSSLLAIDVYSLRRKESMLEAAGDIQLSMESRELSIIPMPCMAFASTTWSQKGCQSLDPN